MNTPEPLVETIDIDAPPVKVWALVSDMPRMASWSPQVVKSFVRGGTPQLGTTVINVNRQGFKVWPTTSKVVRFEPHREFAFRIKENRSIWSFTLEPNGDGTTLVQRRETPDGISKLSNTLVDKVLGGQETFVADLRAGMKETLQKIKAEAEQ